MSSANAFNLVTSKIFLFGKELTVFQPGVSVEEIALVRLASHRYIQDKVQEFREKHTDWKELGAYLMTKHTNREFKKKKGKPDTVTKPTKQSKRMIKRTNIGASETIVRSYLNEKLREKDIETENDYDEDEDVCYDRNKMGKVKPGESENANELGKVRTEDDKDDGSGNKETRSDSDSHLDDDLDDDDDDDDDNSDEGIDTDSDSADDLVQDDDSEIEKYQLRTCNSDKDSLTDEEEEDDSDACEEKMDKKHETDSRKTSKQENDRKSEKKSGKRDSRDISVKKVEKANVKGGKPVKPNIVEKVQGEIIVKKLNLDEWCESEPFKDTGKVPEILLADKTAVENMEEKVKQKKKAFDPFFDTGDRLFQSRDSKPGELGKNLQAFAGYIHEDDTMEQGIDSGVFETRVNMYEKDSEDGDEIYHRNSLDDEGEDVFSEKLRRDDSVYMKANHMGKQAFRTTFMESLNDTGKRDFSKRAPRKDKASNR